MPIVRIEKINFSPKPYSVFDLVSEPNLHISSFTFTLIFIMGNDKPESSIPSTPESSVPVIHIQSEKFGFQAGVILTEVNYDVWSQILEMQIAGREKLEYIMGKTAPPEGD